MNVCNEIKNTDKVYLCRAEQMRISDSGDVWPENVGSFFGRCVRQMGDVEPHFFDWTTRGPAHPFGIFCTYTVM